MPVLKKNQINNVLAVMVDETDFASVESGMDPADINIRLYGVAQGVSTLASTITVSKAARTVLSGIFQITLKASETDAHDHYMLRLSSTSTVSCATQYIPLEMVDSDDSDLMSALTVIQSMASDAASAAAQGNSRIILVQSRLSDLDSRLVSDVSDIYSALLITQSLVSDIDSALTSQFNYTSNAVSDLDSRVTLNLSRISDIQSFLSDMQSDLLSHIDTTGVQLNASVMSDIRSAIAAGPAATVTASDISDIASAVWATALATKLVTLNTSDMSDLRSAIAAGPAATITASDISDIASAVKATLASDISDIYSAATQINSRVLIGNSAASDAYSAIAAGVTVSASSISDIASAVWAQHWNVHSNASSFGSLFEKVASFISDIDSGLTSQFNYLSNAISDMDSRVIVNLSAISDLDSALTSRFSNLESLLGTTGVAVNTSSISDIASAVKATMASDISDIYSAATQTNSRALVIQSLISDVDSQLTVTDATVSNINSMVTVLKTTLPNRPTKNTALANFTFFMVDSTDHVTGKTGLTITATRSLDGAAFAACTNSATEIASGWYKIDLAAADLNGNTVALRFTGVGADSRNITFVTQTS